MMRNRHEKLSASNLEKETLVLDYCEIEAVVLSLFNLQCDYSASTLRPHHEPITGQGWLKTF